VRVAQLADDVGVERVRRLLLAKLPQNRSAELRNLERRRSKGDQRFSPSSVIAIAVRPEIHCASPIAGYYSGVAGRKKLATDTQEMAAAYLWSRGWKQGEIAKDLGLTTRQVQLALAHAEAKGWLVQKPSFRRDRIPAEHLEELESRYDGRPLSINRLLVSPLREIRVVLARNQIEFGRHAAVHVVSYIREARTLGVAWGTDLEAVVSAIEDWPRPDSVADVQFFPVRGEPMLQTEPARGPTQLAQRLDAIWNRKSVPLSLTGVPAMIPLAANTPATHKRLSTVYGASPVYRRIIGGAQPLLSTANGILTSVGSVAVLSAWTGANLETAHGLGSWPIEKLIAGDMAGVSLPLEHVRKQPEAARAVQRLDSCWIGLTRAHLEKCALYGTPGVILCAFAREKAAAVRRACELGFVTRLVVSSALARALDETAA
jgi:DNA-binding transcriptional regulator LsrR (DeoR family)